jgi:short subunit dehydrogenase-like uncharacterized protein
VDLSGEPAWMRQMIDAHHGQATATGARIVLSCGFDSIPFDLGVFVLQQAAIVRSGAPCSEIKTRVTKMEAFASGGTVASVKATIASIQRDPSIAALLDDPFALTPGFVGPEQPPLSAVQRDEELDVWLAPFMIAPINTKNVHRSNMLMEHRYGVDFRYSEMRCRSRRRRPRPRRGDSQRPVDHEPWRAEARRRSEPRGSRVRLVRGRVLVERSRRR